MKAIVKKGRNKTAFILYMIMQKVLQKSAKASKALRGDEFSELASQYSEGEHLYVPTVKSGICDWQKNFSNHKIHEIFSDRFDGKSARSCTDNYKKLLLREIKQGKINVEIYTTFMDQRI